MAIDARRGVNRLDRFDSRARTAAPTFSNSFGVNGVVLWGRTSSIYKLYLDYFFSSSDVEIIYSCSLSLSSSMAPIRRVATIQWHIKVRSNPSPAACQ
jgi:hypothetical protein